MKFSNDFTNEIKALLGADNVFAVTDDNVFKLYGGLFDRARTFVMRHGEAQKHLGTVGEICTFLQKAGADRHSKVVAVGGGVVGDTAGFSAAVYMRGIAWYNVPTTLLAQCDSAIGGKTGVDLGAYKNIVGAFRFPEEVYISAHFLNTLPEREFLCGMGELIKTACLSQEIFDFYEANQTALAEKDARALKTAVQLCARFKDEVVTQDPYEQTGLRKILNYGHTVGHALEAADGHKLSHGQYVLYGMLIENRMFKELLNPAFYERIQKMIGEVAGTTLPAVDTQTVAEAACSDKKNSLGKVSVVVVLRPGETKEVLMEKSAFRNAFTAAYSEHKGA